MKSQQATNTISKIDRDTAKQLIQQIEKKGKYYNKTYNAKTKIVMLILST